MVKKMSRIIQYIKLFFLALFLKCKTWWKNFWSPKESKVISEIPKEDTLVSSEYYNSRFLDTKITSEITVVKEVWGQIDNAIHQDIKFPNPSTIGLFKPMKADYYNMLFPYSPATPTLFVDRAIWAEVISHLPEGYEIPIPVTKQLMKPMSSEYYKSIFSSPLPNAKVFVDNRVWEEVMKNLPSSYLIPHFKTNIGGWSKREKVIMKHQFSESS